jgi:hypothetical protein
MSRISIVYIAGYGRSGSTIVDRLLGTLEGVASLNEVAMFRGDRFVKNSYCSCGERFQECPFWREVIAEALPHETDLRRYLYLHQQIDHNWWFPSIYSGQYSTRFQGMLTEFQDYLRRLYFALAKFSGREVLIDSSKTPTHALLLHGIEGIQVFVLHLVRDVRAVLYSWQRNKYDPGVGHLMPRQNPSRVALFWDITNLFCEMLASRFPYSRLRYEDIVMNPKNVLQSFADNCAPLQGKKLPFDNDGVVHLNSFHSISGNPQRFVSGLTKVVKDDEYAHKMPPSKHLQWTMLSYPLLKRYGYRI